MNTGAINMKAIELVCNNRGLWWLENSNKKRITPKFKLLYRNEVGGFTYLRTSKGHIVYHVMQSKILYSDNASDVSINLRKIDEHLYEMAISLIRGQITWSRLYTQYGAFIRELTCVCNLENGFIAAKKDGKWGFIDEDANDVIPFIYADVKNFNEHGYAVVDLDKKWTHDISLKTVIDMKGKQLLDPIESWSLTFVSKDRVKVDKGRRYAVIDLTGKEIIPAIYSNIIVVGDFYQVEYKGNWGMFDKDGNLLLETIYDEIIETPDKFVVRDFAKIEIAKTKEISKK